jgi:hypothetical protein
VERRTGGAAHRIGEDVADAFAGRSTHDASDKVATGHLAHVLRPRPMRLRRMVIEEVERFPDPGRSLCETGPGRSIARIARAVDHDAGMGQLRCIDPTRAATHSNWLVVGGRRTKR